MNIKSIIENIFKGDSVYYIGGSDSLPPPLSTEEENENLKLMMEDNQDAKNCLIEHNLRLVVYIARKFDNTGINVEDLISIGTIGLIKAINTFKMDKNIKLATYASRCIENEILMYLRRTTKTKTEVSIDEPLNVDVIYRDIEDEVDRQLLNTAISKLNRRERDIIELRFGLKNNGIEKTQKEVADMMGISQSYISRLEKKIISRLRKEIMKFV